MKPALLNTLIEKLPKDPGILGRQEYFNAAVLVPLITIGGELHLLFEKRSAFVPQKHEICFPGGAHDSTDTDFRHTAIRETVEELGILETQIEIIGSLHTFVAPMGAIIEPYVGILHIERLDDLTINPDEVESVFTLPLSYFQQTEPDVHHVRVEMQPFYQDESTGEKIVLLPSQELGLPETYHKPWGRKQHDVYFFNTDKGLVWGLTATMIMEFKKYLNQESVMEQDSQIQERITDYFTNGDLTCTVTTLKILSELYGPKIEDQVMHAATGMHGAGCFGAQCGLVEGAVMYLGIYGHARGFSSEKISELCNQYATEFKTQFDSLVCKELRPEGFHPDNPPHLCESLTHNAIAFSADFVARLEKA